MVRNGKKWYEKMVRNEMFQWVFFYYFIPHAKNENKVLQTIFQ